MSLMKRALTVSLLVLVCVPLSLAAQRGLGGGGLGLYGLGPRLGENVQLALEMQTQLGLSSEQVAALQELQVGIRQNVEPISLRIDELRAGILAGNVSSASGIAELQELFSEYEVAAEPYRVEVDNLLSPQQHRTLQVAMYNTRPLGGLGLGRGGIGAGRLMPGAAGVGLGLGRGVGVGLGRGAGFGMGRGRGGVGLGRARGIGWGAGRGVRRLYGTGGGS